MERERHLPFHLPGHLVCEHCLLCSGFRNTNPMSQPKLEQMIANPPLASIRTLSTSKPDGAVLSMKSVSVRERGGEKERDSVFIWIQLLCVCAHTHAHVPVGERNLFKHRLTFPSHHPLLSLTIISVSPIHGLIPQWQLHFH